MTPPPRLRCRSIGLADRSALTRLLATGFPDRTAAYWARALDRLLDHGASLPDATSGLLLESMGEAVGVLLLIHSARRPDGTPARCNLSSWCVQPAYQAYASLMARQAMRQKATTYFNISPAAHTWSTIEAAGFVRYGTGRMMALPALGPRVRGARVHALDAGGMAGFEPWERELLARHIGYGCLALAVTTAAGTLPFLFLPRRIKGLVPGAQLIYSRRLDDFVRLSGPLGRALLRRGLPVVPIDSSGPIAGLAGRYIVDRVAKYFMGPSPPRVGDMTDTERVMFGP